MKNTFLINHTEKSSKKLKSFFIYSRMHQQRNNERSKCIVDYGEADAEVAGK